MTIIFNKGRMFDFITHTPNPIGGCPTCDGYDDVGHKHCSWSCSYGWCSVLKDRFRYRKYEGTWRIIPHEMKNLGPEDYPFICDMIDIGDPTLPQDIILKILDWAGAQPCQVLLLTKNPRFYRDYAPHIPPNAVLGATIECDLPEVLSKVSDAPSPLTRLEEMVWVKNNLPNQRLICVEPIMNFTPLFAGLIAKTEPSIIAVGYDSGKNSLNEPALDYTRDFIDHLDEITTATIYVKLLRPAWVAETKITEFMKVEAGR